MSRFGWKLKLTSISVLVVFNAGGLPYVLVVLYMLVVELQYYMRTGSCKFGASCKYHHPRQAAGSATPVPLNYYGYPMRVVCLLCNIICSLWMLGSYFLSEDGSLIRTIFHRVRKSAPIMWKLDSANSVQLVNSTIPSLQVSRLSHRHRFPQFHICLFLYLYLHQDIQLYSPNLDLRNNNMVYLLQGHLCYPAQ